jgi:hypothetical protein
MEWNVVCEVWELWGFVADVRWKFIEEMIGKVEDCRFWVRRFDE